MIKVKIRTEDLVRLGWEFYDFRPEYLELEAEPMEPQTEEESKESCEFTTYCSENLRCTVHSKAPKKEREHLKDFPCCFVSDNIDTQGHGFCSNYGCNKYAKHDGVCDLSKEALCLCGTGVLRVTEPAIHTRTECKHIEIPEKLQCEPFIERTDDTRDIRKKINETLDYLRLNKGK